jgi:hypothetical protein
MKIMETNNYDPKQDIFYKLFKLVLNVYKVAGSILVVVAFAAIVIGFSPDLLYYVDAQAIQSDNESLVDFGEGISIRPAIDRGYQQLHNKPTPGNFGGAKELPPVDPSLPKETKLIIPRIGVDAIIHTGADGEAELDKGVWMSPNYGTPIAQLPVLMASHRFGGIGWGTDYRNKNSFGRLPELRGGDEIIVIYQQRKFSYKVLKNFNATGYSIDSTKENLVLYTCKYFRSKERIFVTAQSNW